MYFTRKVHNNNQNVDTEAPTFPPLSQNFQMERWMDKDKYKCPHPQWGHNSDDDDDNKRKNNKICTSSLSYLFSNIKLYLKGTSEELLS